MKPHVLCTLAIWFAYDITYRLRFLDRQCVYHHFLCFLNIFKKIQIFDEIVDGLDKATYAVAGESNWTLGSTSLLLTSAMCKPLIHTLYYWWLHWVIKKNKLANRCSFYKQTQELYFLKEHGKHGEYWIYSDNEVTFHDNECQARFAIYRDGPRYIFWPDVLILYRHITISSHA